MEIIQNNGNYFPSPISREKSVPAGENQTISCWLSESQDTSQSSAITAAINGDSVALRSINCDLKPPKYRRRFYGFFAAIKQSIAAGTSVSKPSLRWA